MKGTIARNIVEDRLASARDDKEWATKQLSVGLNANDPKYAPYLRQKRWTAAGWCEALEWTLRGLSDEVRE